MRTMLWNVVKLTIRIHYCNNSSIVQKLSYFFLQIGPTNKFDDTRTIVALRAVAGLQHTPCLKLTFRKYPAIHTH